MNIDGVSEKTASQLFDALSVRRFSDLYSLDREKLLNLDGFKDKKTDNFIEAVEKSKKCTLENFIFALGIDGIGKKTAKDLAKRYKNINALMAAGFDDLLSMNEIGEVLAKNVVEYFSDEENVREIEKLLKLGVTPEYSLESVSEKFKGEKVVLTGTLERFKRSEAQKLIEQNGGEVMSSVSKLTTLVIAGENAGSKLDKARSLNVRIISESDFIDIINN